MSTRPPPPVDPDEDDLTPQERALAELGPRKAPRRKRTYNVLDVAKARSCSTEAALRWLKRNAKAHMRWTRGEWTIPEAVFNRISSANAFYEVFSRLARLEQAQEEMAQRVSALVAHGKLRPGS